MKIRKVTQKSYLTVTLTLASLGLFLGGASTQTQTQVAISGAGSPMRSLASADVNSQISPARQRARDLFVGLTGVSISVDDSRITVMEGLIAKGQEREAVKVATADPNFYNIRVADMARKMSTREETIRAPLSDFVATFVGVVRDNVNAQELLTGNFYYRMDPALGYSYDANGNKTAISGIPPAAGSQEVISLAAPKLLNMLIYNDYYAFIESQNLSLYNVLTRVNGQMIIADREIIGGGRQREPVPHPQPAGLLTSRAFTEAHASAGTNRRMVEYAFREFMCTPMANMADASQSDSMVGRDVDRAPGGSVQKYQTTCKACHTVMDGFRPAFAHVDFSGPTATNAVVYYPTYHVDNGLTPIDPNQDKGAGNRGGTLGDIFNMNAYPNYVPYKMNKVTSNDAAGKPAFQFPEGYPVTNDSWVNNATGPINAEQFGWRGPGNGKGLTQFGSLLASSFGFSKCMVNRVFTEVCKRAPDNVSEAPLIKSLASEFESKGYNLRDLFEEVSVQPACLGSLQ